jgi:hypothetical protein
MADTKLDRLKSQLLTSGLQKSNNALFQVVNQLIDFLRNLQNSVSSSSSSSSGGGTVTSSQIREAGYWTPLIISNNSNGLLGTYIEDNDLVGELVLTDKSSPIAVWNSTP